jgi:hypothetical protein
MPVLHAVNFDLTQFTSDCRGNLGVCFRGLSRPKAKTSVLRVVAGNCCIELIFMEFNSSVFGGVGLAIYLCDMLGQNIYLSAG